MKKLWRGNPLSDVLVGFLSLLVAIPLFIIAHKQFPDLQWPGYLDRILIFASIVILLLLILRLFRPLIVIGFALAVVCLGYGSLTGAYGFSNLYKDYQAMLYTMRADPDPGRFLFSDRRSLAIQNKIHEVVDDGNPEVRDFSVAATNQYFRDQQRKNDAYRNLIQCLAIFKKINSNWNYVSDPESKEYFATPTESIKLMAGDCDDYSILMAACIKSISGRARLIHTTGHLYPELYIGTKEDLERLNHLIKKRLFATESKGQDLHYHEDKDGSIWINLDYTAPFPGGQFMAEPVLGIMYP